MRCKILHNAKLFEGEPVKFHNNNNNLSPTGLRVALVEKFDFASGTSSRSTKLIHGGVRYLQSAIMSLNYEQYQLVQEALQERANLLQIAPHLSFPLPIMLPVYE